MMRRSLAFIFAPAVLFTFTHTVGWRDQYEAGLRAAKSSKWTEARADFLRAASARHGDSARPTQLPGSPTDASEWRDGAPYSPNFLAAYCEYRAGLVVADPDQQKALLRTAATEMEVLLAHGQRSRDLFFFLSLIYSRLDDQTKRDALTAKLGKRGWRVDWKVDEEIVAPEEVSSMGLQVDAQHAVSAGSPAKGETISASQLAPGSSPTVGPSGSVTSVPQKYALIIGENGDQLADSAQPFATADAKLLKDSLIANAGYSADNVEILTNPNSQQIRDGVAQLAAKVPQDGVALVFYSGPGVNLNGKDFLAGSESTSLTDPQTLVSKSELYLQFMKRGARIFAFFETNRPSTNGVFFGLETPKSGQICQMEATTPDSPLTTLYRNGAQVGLFAQAFSWVLQDLKSNEIPITEFGWQVYEKMRNGNSGQGEGSGHQICTLPAPNNLAQNAWF